MHAQKRKRGPLSETPFPLAKKPLTLAGSNHPSNADNDGEPQKPQPIDASAGHSNIENNVARLIWTPKLGLQNKIQVECGRF